MMPPIAARPLEPGATVSSPHNAEMVVIRLEPDGENAICSWRITDSLGKSWTYSALFKLDELTLLNPSLDRVTVVSP
jgi:hypothetical protein